MKESCHTCERVVSHMGNVFWDSRICLLIVKVIHESSHVAHMNELCYIRIVYFGIQGCAC